MARIARVANDERGATTIEYAAIASLISIVAIAAINSIGASVGRFFGMVPSF